MHTYSMYRAGGGTQYYGNVNNLLVGLHLVKRNSLRRNTAVHGGDLLPLSDFRSVLFGSNRDK